MRVTFLLICFFSMLFAQAEQRSCLTESMSVDQIIEIKQDVYNWSTSRNRNEAKHVIVAWHIVTEDNGATGDYSNQGIYELMEALNSNYMEHNFFFTLDTITRTANSSWFNDWNGQNSGAQEGYQALVLIHIII